MGAKDKLDKIKDLEQELGEVSEDIILSGRVAEAIEYANDEANNIKKLKSDLSKKEKDLEKLIKEEGFIINESTGKFEQEIPFDYDEFEYFVEKKIKEKEVGTYIGYFLYEMATVSWDWMAKESSGRSHWIPVGEAIEDRYGELSIVKKGGTSVGCSSESNYKVCFNNQHKLTIIIFDGDYSGSSYETYRKR